MHDNRKIPASRNLVADTIKQYEIKPGQPMKNMFGAEIPNSTVINDYGFIRIDNDRKLFQIVKNNVISGEEEIVTFDGPSAIIIAQFMLMSANATMSTESLITQRTYASRDSLKKVDEIIDAEKGEAIYEKFMTVTMSDDEIYGDFMNWARDNGINANVYIYLQTIKGLGGATPKEWMSLSNVVESTKNLKSADAKKQLMLGVINEQALDKFTLWLAGLMG